MVHGGTNTVPKCTICIKGITHYMLSDKEKREIWKGNENIAVED